MNISAGQGFKRKTRLGTEFGLIVGVTVDAVQYVRVYDSVADMRHRYSYDEHGAVYSRDKDNVRLNGHPNPFEEVFNSYVDASGKKRSRTMAFADLNNAYKMPLSLFKDTCSLLADGMLLNAKDRDRVINHPWPIQKEKELTLSAEEKAKTQRRLAMLDGFPNIRSASTDFNLDL